MASTIQIRVDDEYNGFPFEIKRTIQNPYIEISEEEMLNKLEDSRKSAAKGNYKSADFVVSDMRGKYGL